MIVLHRKKWETCIEESKGAQKSRGYHGRLLLNIIIDGRRGLGG